jgi:hypothetical protein
VILVYVQMTGIHKAVGVYVGRVEDRSLPAKFRDFCMFVKEGMEIWPREFTT